MPSVVAKSLTIVALLATLAIAPQASAQFGGLFSPGIPTSSDPMLQGTADEQSALQLLDAKKPIKAREIAEKVLKDNPDSFLANWVLSQIFHLEEGRHPRARYLVERCKDMLERRYGRAPTDEAAIWWHKKILESKSEILGEMEDREGQVAALDEYDALYAPKLTRNRVWPLMKLGRHEEAIAAAKTLLSSDDLINRISGYNGLMAIGDEQLDRLSSYDWGQRGIEATQQRSCILLHNTAQAALTLFRFSEAEELARKAIRAEFKDCPSSSYYHLANVYLAQGEFNKAVSAFKKLMRAYISPRYRPMFDKDNKGVLVEILMSLGKVPETLKLVRDVFEHPDRPGMTSISLDDIKFASGVLFWLALDAKARDLTDQASVRSFWDALDLEREIQTTRLKQWEVQRTLMYLAPRDEILITNLRPFLRGVKPWYAGALGRIFGVGLARAAMDEASVLDQPQLGASGTGYFQSISGELYYLAGDYEDAIREGEAALRNLQKENVLLELRTKAYLAGALGRMGQASSPRAIALMREVLNRFPTPLKELDVKIPAVVTHDANDLAKEVADLLVDSDRLDVFEGAPFRVHVAGDRKKITVCIASADGFRLGCGEKTFERPGADLSLDAEKVADAFHTQALSPMVELTSSDINSLDGSTVRANSDEVLKGILKTSVGLEDEEEKE